jgi:hypothetical protein
MKYRPRRTFVQAKVSPEKHHGEMGCGTRKNTRGTGHTFIVSQDNKYAKRELFQFVIMGKRTTMST